MIFVVYILFVCTDGYMQVLQLGLSCAVIYVHMYFWLHCIILPINVDLSLETNLSSQSVALVLSVLLHITCLLIVTGDTVR